MPLFSPLCYSPPSGFLCSPFFSSCLPSSLCPFHLLSTTEGWTGAPHTCGSSSVHSSDCGGGEVSFPTGSTQESAPRVCSSSPSPLTSWWLPEPAAVGAFTPQNQPSICFPEGLLVNTAHRCFGDQCHLLRGRRFLRTFNNKVCCHREGQRDRWGGKVELRTACMHLSLFEGCGGNRASLGLPSPICVEDTMYLGR